MHTKKTFDIFLIRKTPYLSNGLLILCVISSLPCLYFYGIITSHRTTPETKAMYLEHSSTLRVICYSAFSTSLTVLLYHLSKQKRKGLLIFQPDSFELLLKREQSVFLFPAIRRVYCNDPEDKKGNPNKKFTMTIETWKNKKILMRIRNTADIPLFIDKLLSYEQLKIDLFLHTPLD